MAKAKAEGTKKQPSRHLSARITYLREAAHLLSSQFPQNQLDRTQNANVHSESDQEESKSLAYDPKEDENAGAAPLAQLQPQFEPLGAAVSRELTAQVVSIARKSVIRLSPEIKRSICKRCSSNLIENRTCTSRIENRSRKGRKRWADVLVVTCLACRMEKRFPLGTPRDEAGRKQRIKELQSPTQP